MFVRSFAATIATLLFFSPFVPASAAEPLEIPTILPLSGPAAFLGKEYADTIRLLEDRINRTGGFGGRPVHFAIQDDQTNPQVDVQLTTTALARKPPLIIDGAPLALCRSTAPLMHNGPVMWCLSPSMRPDAGSYVYAVMASTRDSIVAALTYFKGRGLTKLAFLNTTDATGADAEALLDDLLKTSAFVGMTAVAQERFSPADISVAAQMSHIKGSGAQAIFAFTTGTPVGTVFRAMSDAGVDLPVFTSQGNMSIAQLDGYKAFVPKELLFPGYPALAPDSIPDAGVRDKVAQFKAEMKNASMSADLLHATPWDPLFLLAEAFKRAGPNATADQLRTTLAGIRNWPGVFGRYDYPANPNRGLGVNWIVISRWDPSRSIWTGASKPGGDPLR